MKRVQHWRAALALILILLPATLAAQPARVMDAAELRLALEKLGVVGSALYVAAHPDDENTAMLSWLASEKKVRSAYLSLTRGDGGQNLIGEEIGPALGVIRTNELLAARRIDGSEQFFTRAVDFGYSKSPDETFANWDREAILSDVVWVIRSFRPDIIITRFPTDAPGGHGQHTASALLALEAFSAAADPARFPGQLRHVQPWQARRIMWNHWNPTQTQDLVEIDLGTYNALLGRSYTEIAGESRSQHKSQGFGAAERRGTIPNFLRTEKGARAKGDPFEGVDLTWGRISGGEAIGARVARIQELYDPLQPAAIVPELVQLRKLIRKLDDPDARFKLRELDAIIRSAAGLWLEAIAPTSTVTAGASLEVEATAIRRGATSARVTGVRFLASDGTRLQPTPDRSPSGLPVTLDHNTPVNFALDARVPASAPLSEPYWLRDRPADSREPHYAEPAPQLRAEPVGPPPFAVAFDIAFGDEIIRYHEPVQRRWVDRVRGELYELTRVIPPVTVTFGESLLIFPEPSPRQLELTMENRQESPVEGEIHLSAADGWTIRPSVLPLSLAGGERSSSRVTITPSAEAGAGQISASLHIAGATRTARSLHRIDYEHIPAQLLMPETMARLVRADVRRSGERIGYIQGSGDEGPTALSQVGYTVTELTDAQIARGDLSQFDAIVVGVRAFNAREAARENASRLHEYVRGGGTLVVQYHTADRTLVENFAPVPLRLGRGRVTVEGAPVQFVDPDHPLLTRPNRLSQSDFEGWVQERGLYFGESWDPAYQAPLASADPGEAPITGGLLYVPYGEGHFIYTGYSFFRQIPAGVPGAIRLFVNLVSIGAEDASR